MSDNKWFRKEAPLQGLMGLWGGVSSALSGALPFTGMQATGGQTNTYTVNGENFKAHKFTSDGTFTVQALGTGEQGSQIDFLLVGGGGGGGDGNANGGGAGAGGLLKGVGVTVQTSPGQYYATIANGGEGRGSDQKGYPGNDSNLTIPGMKQFTALGGGGGGGYSGAGEAGGSGGGASGPGNGPTGTAQNVGEGVQPNEPSYPTITGYGNDGGTRGGAPQYGGGGGGAGKIGGNSPQNPANSPEGKGGDGLALDYWDGSPNTYWAGGGGGGQHPNQRSNPGTQTSPQGGGLGGGGCGGGNRSPTGGVPDARDGIPGQANTGGGGGGAADGYGGNGGKGVFVVRYRVDD